MWRKYQQLVCGLLFILVSTLAATPTVAQTNVNAPTQYLAFQIFTGALPPNTAGDNKPQPLSPPPSKAALKQTVQQIVNKIGSTGDQHHKLAFILGPLAFDYTDAELRQMVRDSFEIGVELNIAVGFHVDDSMFWARRSDLWHDPKNVEWLDWAGTPNTGRRIDWSAQPTKLTPQMCLNSLAIQTEVTRLADEVIGKVIREQVDKLTAQGRPDLFAGVIVGWETQMGQDFDTNQFLGYCGLSNRGFSRANPPQNLDSEREKVIHTFIALWASGFEQARIDQDKIYSHTAPLARTVFDSTKANNLTYSQANHFAPPEVSFGDNFHPGFSTYPQTGMMEELYADFQKHGNPTWASAEGSTVVPSAEESVVKTETYLGWMFNHNAALVNIFGWGVGTESENPFWKAADSSEAIVAYRKFLSGQTLIEDTTDLTSSVSGTLPDKVHKIQAALPTWLPQHPDQQSKIQLLLSQLDQALKAGNYHDASTIADTILALIAQ